MGDDQHVALAREAGQHVAQPLLRLELQLGPVRDLRLDDRVDFVGEVLGADKLSLYQASDLFVLPTSQENFGLVLPEALACGTPVVTTKGVDIWPELESSGGALIADPATPEQFAQHIGALLGTRARRDEMGAKGREWVLSSLSAESVMGLYVEMYREAITRGS